MQMYQFIKIFDTAILIYDIIYFRSSFPILIQIFYRWTTNGLESGISQSSDNEDNSSITSFSTKKRKICTEVEDFTETISRERSERRKQNKESMERIVEIITQKNERYSARVKDIMETIKLSKSLKKDLEEECFKETETQLKEEFMNQIKQQRLTIKKLYEELAEQTKSK